MKSRGKSTVILFLLLTSISLSVYRVVHRPVNANPQTEVYVEPENSVFYTHSTPLNSRFNVTVWVRDVHDLTAFRVVMRYDNNMLEATRALIPRWDEEYVFYMDLTWEYEQDLYLGYVVVNVSERYPYPGFDGSGKLCIIEFEIAQQPQEGEDLRCLLNIAEDVEDPFTILINQTLPSNPVEIPADKINGHYVYTTNALVYVTPQNIILATDIHPVGTTLFNVIVWANDTSDLYTWQVVLRYDPTMLEIVGAGQTYPSTHYVFYNRDSVLPDPYIGDNYVMIGDSLIGQQPGFSGNGTLCGITFRIIQEPPDGGSISCTLDISQVETPNTFLSDSDMDDIPADLTNGQYQYWSWRIYTILENGDVDPPTPLIERVNDVYRLTDNLIGGCIVVERDNIVVDGVGYFVLNPVDISDYREIGILAVNRFNVTVTNVGIHGFQTGIDFVSSSYSEISHNILTDCTIGIEVDFYSCNNSIVENHVENNEEVGIWIDDCSDSNTVSENNVLNNFDGIWVTDSLYNNITGNNIRSNLNMGIFLGLWEGSLYNSITRNDIRENEIGIELLTGHHNRIFHNNFIDNFIQAISFEEELNFWDDDYPSGGNYWSDHILVDEFSGREQSDPGADWIVDDPYEFDFSQRDHYPLMGPWITRGLSIQVFLMDNVDIVFGEVVEEGMAIGQQVDELPGPMPPGFILLGENCYNIEANAVYNGPIQIIIAYDDSGLSPGQENNLQIMQWDEAQQQWVNILADLDIANNLIYGEAEHLSVFAVTLPSDIATEDIAASKSFVGQGYPMNINITVENQGGLNYTFNIILYHDKVAEPATEQWNTFWSMGDVNRDGYIDQVDWEIIGENFGWVGAPGENPADINSDGIVDTEDALICASNNGKDIWTYFGLSPPPIGKQTVTLTSGRYTTIFFVWNTTGFAKGNYTVWAYAWPVTGEIDITDNTFVYGFVIITIPGDVDGDFEIDILDVVKITGIYGSRQVDPQFNPNSDIDNDGEITILDVVICTSHYGQTHP